MTSLHIAALLLFLLGAAHSILGERFILIRLFRREDLPRLFGGPTFTTRTLRFAWHLTTLAWWAMAVMLWWAGAGTLTPRDVLEVVGVVMIVSGLLPLFMTGGRHLAWIVFFVIGAIALWQAGG